MKLLFYILAFEVSGLAVLLGHFLLIARADERAWKKARAAAGVPVLGNPTQGNPTQAAQPKIISGDEQGNLSGTAFGVDSPRCPGAGMLEGDWMGVMISRGGSADSDSADLEGVAALADLSEAQLRAWRRAGAPAQEALYAASAESPMGRVASTSKLLGTGPRGQRGQHPALYPIMN